MTGWHVSGLMLHDNKCDTDRRCHTLLCRPDTLNIQRYPHREPEKDTLSVYRKVMKRKQPEQTCTAAGDQSALDVHEWRTTSRLQE